VKTDDRETTDGTGEDGAENVVRLPRDWVGPPEELVPMGSRARAREREEIIPGADDFWGEGAAAVHGAIQPSARHADRTTTVPPARVRARRPLPRRPWGFTVRPAPRRESIGSLRVRPRIVALAVAVTCLVAVAAIGLAEGGGHPPTTNALVNGHGHGSGEKYLLGPTAGGLPSAGLLASARIARADLSKQEARERAAARRARATHRRLLREMAARRRRRGAAKHDAPTTSSGSPVTSTPTSPTETTAPPPTTTTPTATSAGGSGSSGTHVTSTHHSAFGQSGLLGAGHSSGDS
jgi:hypothetical protein